MLWKVFLVFTALATTVAGRRRPQCSKPPKPTICCIRAGGYCVDKPFDCPGVLDSRGCKGRGCKCCIPGPGPKDCNKDCGHWCYPSKNWPYTCPNFCSWNKQSPIDICGDFAKTEVGDITFSSSYSDSIKLITIKNNGHTVGASWDSSLPSRTISDGGLPGEYTLAQFHFHWGCRNNRGSEHTVNGTRYSMELHFVHYRTIHGNLTEAIKYKDGLAVLGIFFDVDTENDDIGPIIDNLQKQYFVNAGDSKEIYYNKALINLIPTTRTFYRYQGSLTTPTCNEVVIWSVFSTPLSFSDAQVEEFRKLKDKEGHKMCDNYRGIQPLNGRVVSKYEP